MGRKRARCRGHRSHFRPGSFAFPAPLSDDTPVITRWWWWHPRHSAAARSRASSNKYTDVAMPGEDLGPGAAAMILRWAAASPHASGISALDAFKGSVTALAESPETQPCSASASMCANCIREDGGVWGAECFERFCHLFACLDSGQRSGPDQSCAANEAAYETFDITAEGGQGETGSNQHRFALT